MQPLSQSQCVPCRGGVPPLTAEAVRPLAAEIPEWRVVESDGIARLERTYTFPDFRSAMAFAVRVGELADAEDHHPELHVGWGHVRIEIWTHKIRGLHRNDFVLAAKIGLLAAGA